jgi:hypothetical protein
MFNEGEAILITCDSRATAPIGIMYEIKKAYPIMIGEEPIAIASGAGSRLYITPVRTLNYELENLIFRNILVTILLLNFIVFIFPFHFEWFYTVETPSILHEIKEGESTVFNLPSLPYPLTGQIHNC